MQHTITRRHVSFNLTGLIVLLSVLAMVAAAITIYVGTQPVAPSGNNITAIVATQPKDFAALKDAQLEMDAARIGSANVTFPGAGDNYRALQKEQRDAVNFAKGAGAVPILVRPKDYASLKDAQLEQFNAQIGSTTLPAPGVVTINGCKIKRDVTECP